MRDWASYLREHLDLPALRGHRDERAIREIADHLEDLYRDALVAGRTEEEAEAMVIAWLGDPAEGAEKIMASTPGHRQARADRWLDRREDALRGRGLLFERLADGLRDLRTGLRSLRRRPLFAGVVVLVLALGIGSTTAIFTLLDAVVLNPLPFDEAKRLVAIRHSAPALGMSNAGQCAAWHFTYEEETRVFGSLGMFRGSRATITGEGTPEAVPTIDVTQGVFPALRLQPVVGRLFRAEDHDPDGPRRILLGYGFWQSRFGGDPAVVGRILRVDGIDREIIGVMPRTVRLLGRDGAVIRPLRYRRPDLFVGNIGFGAVARLADGVTLNQAQADLTRVLPMAWEKFPGGPAADFGSAAEHRVEVLPFKDVIVGSASRLLWTLLGAVAIVLLIAAANVANLMLVHFEGRQGELAVRTALGASRARILWDHLKESLPLALLGGALGLALGQVGLHQILGFVGVDLPRADSVGLSHQVISATVMLSLACGLVLGWIPSRRLAQVDPVDTLREHRQDRVIGRSGRRSQSLLTIGQVAMVLVLLVAGGLMVRSFLALSRVPPGFGRPDELLTMRLYIPRQEVQTSAEVATTYESITHRLEEVPGVTGVALATGIPMDGGGNVNPLYVQGSVLDDAANGITRRHKWIGGGYLEALQIPLVVGRALTWDDVHDRAPVALLSEGLARELFGSAEAAMGQRIAARPDPPVWKEVVGVVADVHEDGLRQVPPALVYWPHATLAFWQNDEPDDLLVWRRAGIAIRGQAIESPAFLEAVRQAVWDVNPNLPVPAESMRSLMQGWTDQTSFCTLLLVLAGVVGVILAVVGVYGVVAYGVARRTFELGLRMAVGARLLQVQSMVVRQGLVLGAIGVGIGLAAAVALSQVMSSLLFDVSPIDPLTYVAVAAALLIAVGAASYLPARRASKIDPMAALRSE